MIISLIFLALIAFLVLKRDRSTDELLKKHWEKARFAVFLGSAGLYLRDLVERAAGKIRNLPKKAKEPGPVAEEKRAKNAVFYGGGLAVLFFGAVLNLVLSVFMQGSRPVTEIVRPEFGETAEAALIASYGGETEEIRVPITGRVPGDAEWDAVFESAFQNNQKSWLGENPSFDRVSRDLRLPREDEKGIRYHFESGDPEVLSESGYIVAEELDPEGTEIVFTVTLSYENHSKTFRLPVRLYPAETVKKSELEAALEAANESDPSAQTVKLPSEVAGKEISFEKRGLSPLLVPLFTLVAAILFFLLPKSREKEEKKERDTELRLTYAKAVTGLSSYISAGLSIRNAWIRLSERYRIENEAGKRPKEAVFEEMCFAANELKSGIPEEEVYKNFGQRIGEHRYRKLANLLAENVRQGISGLAASLEAEARDAIEERKRVALKKGDEASTKLLFPMMILLGIVIVVLIVPVFMMF